MRLRHNSRLACYRSPFGAVAAGARVRLALDVLDVDPDRVRARVRVWVDGAGERFVDMRRDEAQPARWRAELACEKPDLMWYSFVVEADDEVRHLGCAPDAHGGEGAQSAEAWPPSFQITVFEPREVEPAWYTRGVAYQIFPDRHRRGPQWRRLVGRALAEPRAGVPKRLVEDWYAPPAYDRAADGSIASWDFYGGTLSGIREDLPRLRDLGVTTLYLNPIFRAASNHRYDVGDYFRVDPMLGDEDDFRALCAAAERQGISVILDGVFNHTGADSRTFNRYGNYPDAGAWQGEGSPWRDAYTFRDDGTYECWWGVEDLPSFRKDAPQVRELLLGEDGVVRHWLRLGARGWRLDVADELADDLLEGIRDAALAERPDAVVIGEVWEDASNKISYGRLRRYLLGRQLDGAMNYPLRSALLDFLTGETDAPAAAEALEALRENYPPQAFAACLNVLGSHDRPRLLSVLSGLPDADAMSEEQRAAWRPDPETERLAKGRFWLAELLVTSLPGVPCVYHGDEAGLHGLSDPANRAGFPWGREDADAQTMVRRALDLRRACPPLVDGAWRARAFGDDVLGVERACGEEGVVVLANRDARESRTVRVALPRADGAAAGAAGAPTPVDLVSGEAAAAGAPTPVDLVSGEAAAPDGDGCVTVHLAPLGSAALYVAPRRRLGKPLEPGVGVLCHVTSLPTDDGRPGHLGEAAFRFVDALAAAGVRYWQVLPVAPVDKTGSPYAGPSAFAGNVNLLGRSETELRAAFERFERADGAHSRTERAALDAWRAQEAEWLEPWCAFAARTGCAAGGPPRTAPAPHAACANEERFAAWCQYRFDAAWRALVDYAHARGVELVGDIPFCVSARSADAASSPELFSLDEAGGFSEEAGCPPDRFTDEGQRWGSPTYRWDALRAQEYRWWVARLARAMELYDYVRLDHFLGFERSYGIPANATAKEGVWHLGPGRELFERAAEELGALPFVAEDLGVLTPAVHALRARCGFPGMDVVQFADYDVRAGLRPRPDKLLYTSTHDTPTLVQWCAERFAGGDERTGRALARELLRDALACGADVVVVPLQDAALLGADARMNTPGTTSGNWTWQATEAQMAEGLDNLAALMGARTPCADAGA